MHIAELAPLVAKVRVLRSIPATQDIAAFVEDRVARANTPSAGQSVCDAIITMCNPRAWGDRQVEGFGADWSAWDKYLGELSELAEKCGQAIFESSRGA